MQASAILPTCLRHHFATAVSVSAVSAVPRSHAAWSKLLSTGCKAATSCYPASPTPIGKINNHYRRRERPHHDLRRKESAVFSASALYMAGCLQHSGRNCWLRVQPGLPKLLRALPTSGYALSHNSPLPFQSPLSPCCSEKCSVIKFLLLPNARLTDMKGLAFHICYCLVLWPEGALTGVFEVAPSLPLLW